MSAKRRYISSLFLLVMLLLVSARLRGQEEASTEKVFAAVPFDRWVQQGTATEIPWKVRILPFGLSLHQRMRAHIDVELKRRDLRNRPLDDRLAVLIQVADAKGRQFRDYLFFRMQDVVPEIKKGEVDVFWNMYLLPGDYNVTLALLDAKTGNHNLMQAPMHVGSLKDDPIPTAWEGLPAVEFLDARLRGPDAFFRADINSKLHLPLATQHPIELEVLADVTASDLFRGSASFYSRYLSVALPLLKALSQISLERGWMNVAMLDLRKRAVTFEQDDVKALDWPKARNALAPDTGPTTIDIKELEKRRESPAFLQDELLRRLTAAPADQPRSDDPLHVFVIIGSPMDFYSFRNLPHLPPGSEEKCVVYYLQFELLNTTYADGAVGNMRKMLAPLPVHVFKVRSPESVRNALARILNEVKNM